MPPWGSRYLVLSQSKLGKRTIDVLLDTAPKGMINKILNEVNRVKGVLDVANVRVRPSGVKLFIDLNIGINRNDSHREVHGIAATVRERLEAQIPNSDILISTFPVDLPDAAEEEIYATVKQIVARFPNCTNIHNINVYDIQNEKQIAIHLEAKERMNLSESHQLSHQITDLVQQKISGVKEVNVYFEYVKQQNIQAEDITIQRPDLVSQIDAFLNKTPEKLNCHDIKLYKLGEKIAIFLHCELKQDCSTERIEKISEIISTKIQTGIANVESVHIHVEPMQNY